MSKYRTKQDARKDNPDLFKLVRGPNGRNLCRYCGTETKPPRRTFCSAECVHQWNIRSNWSYARSQVIKRDKGICALCQMDCRKERREALKLPPEERVKRAEELGIPKHRLYKKWYDIDHIVPVCLDSCEETGGVGLEGLRLLCLKCHRKVTAELRARLAANKK